MFQYIWTKFRTIFRKLSLTNCRVNGSESGRVQVKGLNKWYVHGTFHGTFFKKSFFKPLRTQKICCNRWRNIKRRKWTKDTRIGSIDQDVDVTYAPIRITALNGWPEAADHTAAPVRFSGPPTHSVPFETLANLAVGQMNGRNASLFVGLQTAKRTKIFRRRRRTCSMSGSAPCQKNKWKTSTCVDLNRPNDEKPVSSRRHSCLLRDLMLFLLFKKKKLCHPHPLRMRRIDVYWAAEYTLAAKEHHVFIEICVTISAFVSWSKLGWSIGRPSVPAASSMNLKRPKI